MKTAEEIREFVKKRSEIQRLNIENCIPSNNQYEPYYRAKLSILKEILDFIDSEEKND